MTARIFVAAKERLIEIWDYTAETWGEAQADKYVRGLIEAVEQMHGSRYCWRAVADEELAGIFYISYQHHFIFFRELSKGTPGVISILHENMDIPSRLKEDAERSEKA